MVTKFAKVSVCPHWGEACMVLFRGGMHGFIQGACVVLFRGACVILFGGACVVLFGGHVWFYLGVCMVLLGGCAWFYLGGVCGFIWGHAWFYSGGHAWLYSRGGVCGFFSFFGYSEIRSMSGRYTSYWNAFLCYV